MIRLPFDQFPRPQPSFVCSTKPYQPQLPPLSQHRLNYNLPRPISTSVKGFSSKLNTLLRQGPASLSHITQAQKINSSVLSGNHTTNLLTAVQQQLIINPQQAIAQSDVDRLLQILIERGKKIQDLLNLNQVKEDGQFISGLKNSLTVRMGLQNLMEQLHKKGRLGIDLKGLNKKIIEQFENAVAGCIQKQIKLYLITKQCQQASKKVKNQILSYKAELAQQLRRLQEEL